MKIRIGTRKSKLAMVQTKMTAELIKSKFSDINIEIVPICTKGDRVLDKPLAEIGGKGLFVSEIENALLSGEIDAAVHSAKDLPVYTAEGLEISGVLPRGNYRDALVAAKGRIFAEDEVFTVGTGSLRRQLNIKRLYPNVKFEGIRGNVDTRLRKLREGSFDGIILAMAGIERLGIPLEEYSVTPFDYEKFLPAPCQGIIAVQCRKNDFASDIVRQISDKNTSLCFQTEREAVRLMGGDCTTPAGAYSEVRGNEIFLKVSKNSDTFACGTASSTEGLKLAEELISQL